MEFLPKKKQKKQLCTRKLKITYVPAASILINLEKQGKLPNELIFNHNDTSSFNFGS